MKTIAIVPARSGSKGLPDKNIVDLNGKPLMYYTIKAAIDSGCCDEIMVSTNSEKYAEIAKKCGANVPFLRTEETACDNAGSWDVVREVLANYSNMNMHFDYVCLLQPTSPLRTSGDVIASYELLAQDGITNVVSITETEHPVQWCFKLTDNGCMDEMACSPYSYMRRQELDKYYRENGSIYWIDADKIRERTYNFYSDNCYGYVMPRERSIDIDNSLDLRIAEIYCLERKE